MGSIIDFVELNPVSTAIGVGAAGIGLGVGAAALVGAASKTKTRRTRSKSRDHKFISKQKHERNRKRKTPGRIYKRKGLYYSRTKRAGSRKKKRSNSGGRKVFYARKTGQPYIKLASGKARFIKGKRRKR